MASEIDWRSERAARNESLFREVNERVEVLAQKFGLATEMTDFICECAQPTCAEVIQMTVREYEEIRRDPTHFAIAAGHEATDIERVVEKTDRYFVVAKIGTAGQVAKELDPRESSRT